MNVWVGLLSPLFRRKVHCSLKKSFERGVLILHHNYCKKGETGKYRGKLARMNKKRKPQFFQNMQCGKESLALKNKEKSFHDKRRNAEKRYRWKGLRVYCEYCFKSLQTCKHGEKSTLKHYTPVCIIIFSSIWFILASKKPQYAEKLNNLPWNIFEKNFKK